jgi:hypothetical protein
MLRWYLKPLPFVDGRIERVADPPLRVSLAQRAQHPAFSVTAILQHIDVFESVGRHVSDHRAFGGTNDGIALITGVSTKEGCSTDGADLIISNDETFYPATMAPSRFAGKKREDTSRDVAKEPFVQNSIFLTRPRSDSFFPEQYMYIILRNRIIPCASL